MNILFTGFLIGLAYVAPIGMQNLYVINSATSLSRRRALTVALITICMDISLALSAYFGMGFLIENNTMLKMIINAVGAVAVVYIGVGLIRSKVSQNKEVDVKMSISKIALTCFSVTWLNPQALIDGTLLLGGMRSTLTGADVQLFIFGVCFASFFWFISLSTITFSLKSFLSDKVLRVINILCGIVIISFGIKLAINFVKML